MPVSSTDQTLQAASPHIEAQPLFPPEPFSAPAPRSNSRVVKAILITVACFFGLGVLAVGALGFATWHFARSIHAVPSATFSETDLGIAIYPGAEPSLHGSRGQFAGKSMLNATYLTRDPADQVIAFYQQKAGPTAHLTTLSHGSELRLSRAEGDRTTVQIMSLPAASGGLTYIRIMRVTEAAVLPR
jgi:hypothetical protein